MDEIKKQEIPPSPLPGVISPHSKSLVKTIIIIAVLLIMISILGFSYYLSPRVSDYEQISPENINSSPFSPTPISNPISPTVTTISQETTPKVNTPTPTLLKPTATPTPIKSGPTPTPTRTPNPPQIGLSWPNQGESVVSLSDQICFIDAPIGGDTSGIQRRRMINEGDWEPYIPVYPSSSTCFNPKEGNNVLSLQYKNQYGEESQMYIRSFYFHKEVPTPTPTPDTTPPVINQLDGPANGEVVNSNTFCFTAQISDNVSNYPNLWIRYKFEGGSWNAWMNNYSQCFSAQTSQSIVFSVQAKDEAGNESAVTTRSFTVNP